MFSLSIRKLCTHSPSSYGVYTLQAHVWFKIFTGDTFFTYLHSPHMFQDSLCIQLLSKNMLGLKFTNFQHSPHMFQHVVTFSYHNSPYSYLVYTLQAHVMFKIFKLSREIIFSCYHSPHMFQGSLSIQLFGLHAPRTC